MEPFYPLDLLFCGQCHLVQIEEVETAAHIFNEDYAYFSSYSDSWLEHCRRYTGMIIERLKLDDTSFVMEVASNDGYLLQYMVQRGIPVLGVEPTANTAVVARQRGVPTDVAFFTAAYAEDLTRNRRRCDLIIGNNVLAHNPHLGDFVAGLKAALAPTGTITIEVPHLLQLLAQSQFDTVYHEHYSYFSVLAARYLFARHHLVIYDLEELPTHGGSIRLFIGHPDTHPVADVVAEVIAREKAEGLDSRERFTAFGQQVEAVKRGLLRFLIEQRELGKRVVGYGAPAKANTLLNYCGVRTDLLEFTVDRSPHKQGKYLPGTHIPIRSPDAIFDARPDFVFILPWNLKDEIMSQMRGIRAWGGRFVTAIPSIQVHE